MKKLSTAISIFCLHYYIKYTTSSTVKVSGYKNFAMDFFFFFNLNRYKFCILKGSHSLLKIFFLMGFKEEGSSRNNHMEFLHCALWIKEYMQQKNIYCISAIQGNVTKIWWIKGFQRGFFFWKLPYPKKAFRQNVYLARINSIKRTKIYPHNSSVKRSRTWDTRFNSQFRSGIFFNILVYF